MTALSAALVGAGTVLAVLAALSALRPGSVYRRLHYLTVINSLAAPLIGLGLLAVDGFGLTGATIALIVLLQAVCGPVLGAATAKLNAKHDGKAGRP